MDTHFDRRHEYYDDTYKAPLLKKKQCGNMPSLHLIDNQEDDQIIDPPDEVFDHKLRTLADRTPARNLFEHEHPRTETNKVVGHTNMWYNGHRGYGSSEPVHPELNTEFFGWVEPRGTAIEPDRSKLVNQDAYRLRYKYLYPSGTVNTPEAGVYEKDSYDMSYSSIWSALGQLKVFYRSLGNFIRTGLAPAQKPQNRRNLVVHSEPGFGKGGINPQSQGGTSVSKYNLSALRALHSQGLSDVKFARTYDEALRSNPEAGEYWKAGRKHGDTDKEQFSQSESLPTMKNSTKREIKSLTRYLQDNDEKLSSQEKTVIRQTIKKGNTFLNNLRKMKAGNHDSKFDTAKVQEAGRAFGAMLQKASNTPTMRKMAKAEGFTDGRSNIHNRVSKNLPKLRSSQAQRAYEKLTGYSREQFVNTQGKRVHNPNTARQQMIANIMGDSGKESFVYSRNNNMDNDTHRRGMDRFTDVDFDQEKNTLFGKTAGARNPHAIRGITQMEVEDGLGNTGLMNHRGGGAGGTGIARGTHITLD